MLDEKIDIIEELRKRNISESEIDVAIIMMGKDPFVTKALTADELRIKSIMEG